MKYSREQISRALYLLDELGSIKKVISILGYPSSRESIYNWLKQREKYCLPSDRQSNRKFTLGCRYASPEAIKSCLQEGFSVELTSKKLGYSTATVYKWRKLLQLKGILIMTNKNSSSRKTNQESSASSKEIEALKAQMYEMQLEMDILRETINVLKKDPGIDLKTLKNSEKAVIVDALKNKYALPVLLRKIHLSRSSYYYVKRAKKQPNKYHLLISQIKELFFENKKSYGYRRIHSELKKLGIKVSEKIVRRLMSSTGLVVKIKVKRKYSSYQGEITDPVPNVIERDFHADIPNQKWLTDITEFSIPAGKVYLSPIIDCFDGLPVSWTIGTSPNANLVNTMLDDAIETLRDDEKPIVHSDRGCHYRWSGWIERMEKADLTRSMSKKGCSPDNSACEGFFGRLKNEMFYCQTWDGVTLTDFIKEVDSYIKWYREKRIKMSLGGKSPLDYRRSLGMVA